MPRMHDLSTQHRYGIRSSANGPPGVLRQWMYHQVARSPAICARHWRSAAINTPKLSSAVRLKPPRGAHPRTQQCFVANRLLAAAPFRRPCDDVPGDTMRPCCAATRFST
jgi:hypothetical protein